MHTREDQALDFARARDIGVSTDGDISWEATLVQGTTQLFGQEVIDDTWDIFFSATGHKQMGRAFEIPWADNVFLHTDGACYGHISGCCRAWQGTWNCFLGFRCSLLCFCAFTHAPGRYYGLNQ
jgi:hypothetical protein